MSKLTQTLTKKQLTVESSGVELIAYMKSLGLTPCRVLAKDQLYEIINNKQYSATATLQGYNIINIGTLDTGGTHWVSLYVPYSSGSGVSRISVTENKNKYINKADYPNTAVYFCSFGGYPLAGLESLYNDSILYYNKQQIQDITQVSCGYFAVGALKAKKQGEFVYYCSNTGNKTTPKLFGTPGKKNEDILLKYLQGTPLQSR